MSNRTNIAELYKLYEDKMQSFIVTDEFYKIRRKIIDKTDEINKNLTDEQKSLLKEILELENQIGALEEEQVFIFAFRLAVNLLLDSLVDVEENGKEDCICQKV